ncbi:hypothetical protein PAXINDRAFT_157883 [Paxillus involutus ATCC 200175]|uniref:Uncharacterized protein n=1 Tax=Paxillus involutus ATCC 200175 TaxID=664439 RepID=A0A0C9SQ81_PAXIN|nr:hypothetical protein PAXINDRAFT_157883 [Paxillus involutus ATCC 200175]
MRGLMLMACLQPGGSNSSTQQHFMQQSALLLMLPGKYRAITERYNISISLMCVPWGEADNACLYDRTLARHLLIGDAPLSDTICQALQGYELHVSSADLAAWYGEDLPSGLAPAPALVGLALVEAFATPSGTVVSPGEASNPPVPGPQDQDQDMGGPPAPSETGTALPSSSDTMVVGHVATELMEVESPLTLISSEPELAQEGAGVRALQGPLP